MKKIKVVALTLGLCAAAAFAAALLIPEPAVAANPVNIQCDQYNFCLAYTFGGSGNYTYSWSGSGGALPANSGTSDSMQFLCSGTPTYPRARVTIYDDFGKVGSNSTNVAC